MCTSYEFNPADHFDVFSLLPVPDFDYKREIYKDYPAPIFRRVDGEFTTDSATYGNRSDKSRASEAHGTS
jgi:hypothetical protein